MSIGGVNCAIDSNSGTEIVCTLDSLALPGGDVPVTLKTDQLGNSENSNAHNPVFKVSPALTSINPTQGSLNGGQLITLDGTGLRGNIKVFMNGQEATLIGNDENSESAIVVKTAAGQAGPVNFYIERLE